jgi:hypothetical protein
MEYYQIITDEKKLDDFLTFLPEIDEDTEVYYLSLFGRHKYCKEFPNMRDDSQLARFTSRRSELKQKIMRLQCPVGSWHRDGNPVPQEALALYMAYNPRLLAKANRELLIELARRITKNDLNFNPISLATTKVHRAVSRKFFVDFDFDDVKPEEKLPHILQIFDKDHFKILVTRGGFHLIVMLDKVRHQKDNWYTKVTNLGGCDVKGSNTMAPVPGCIQGGFTPYFLFDKVFANKEGK